MKAKTIEGVPYYPFVVRFRVRLPSGGTARRAVTRWSPALQYAYTEVGRELANRGDVVERSATIRAK